LQLKSQLKWRLFEGQGEAFYEIGVEDSGFPQGLAPEDLNKSIEVRATDNTIMMCKL